MTCKVFNVIRSIPTLRGHARRIKILVNLKRVNTSTIDLNNKRVTNHSRRVACISSHSKSPLLLEKEKLYVEWQRQLRWTNSLQENAKNRRRKIIKQLC